MTKKVKILSLLQVLGHPRDSKRIASLQNSGFLINVVSFERDYHSGRMPECPVEILDKIENGKYLSRLFKIIRSLPKLRRCIKEADVIYASGQDMAAMAYLAGIGLSKPIVLEVGDIVNLQLSKNILGELVRKIERFLINRYKLIVVISPGFLKDYYQTRLGVKTPGLVLENKLELSFAQQLKGQRKGNLLVDDIFKKRPVRIGYFGLLRDEWSWKVLERLATTNSDRYEIIFAGMQINPKDIELRTSAYVNMTYLGEYKSPTDLPKLYTQVDIVWACYSYIGDNDWNLKWGRPNRFYESCFFYKPTFARKGAHFAIDVEKNEIGKIIDTYEIDDVVKQIQAIDTSDFVRWNKNLIELPEEFYLYTNEPQQLANAIKKMV